MWDSEPLQFSFLLLEDRNSWVGLIEEDLIIFIQGLVSLVDEGDVGLWGVEGGRVQVLAFEGVAVVGGVGGQVAVWFFVVGFLFAVVLF